MGAAVDHASRAHALLSASSSARWIACPASAVASAKYENADTAFTREGTAAHEVAEMITWRLINTGEKMPDTVGFDPDMVRHAEGYRDYIQSLIEGDCDVVMLEERVDFSRWVPGGFGTADCIIVGDGKLTVIDYKYGQGVAVSAVDNPQMKLYALGAYDLLSDMFEFSSVSMHIYQPRLDHISVDAISVPDLLSWAETVVKPAADEALNKRRPRYSAGSHCRFCPHAGSCPTLAKYCSSVLVLDGKPRAVENLAPWEVADILSKKQAVSSWLKAVEDRARLTILDGGEIPGYKVVEGRLGNRKWTDEAVVLDACCEAGYSVNDVTRTQVLSPSEMDKALGKKKAAELLSGYVTREPGAPALVPESDKRPAINRLADAQNDFEGE